MEKFSYFNENKIDFEKELNASQLKAVTSVDGTYLVIAGAGSGKTRTLVYRVAYLINKGFSPNSIVLLTFTRKAAEEMMSRASSLLDERCYRINGGTFHSFANLTLRRYHNVVKLNPNFTILDQADSEDLISQIRKEHFPKVDKRFPNKSAIYSLISLSVNKELPIFNLIETEYPYLLNFADDIYQISENYKKMKYENQLLDYDDLLIYLNNFLMDDSIISQNFVNSINFVMVDEFQDTNKLQGEIVKNLAKRNNNIMVVGDDCQSIYAFRGANFKNIIDFPKLFPNCEIIFLNENYRSIPQILSLANVVIDNAVEKFPKKLVSMREDGNMPTIVFTKNENEQSIFVVKAILKLYEKGVKFRDIAVLFRSSFHSFDLEIYLQAAGIPYIKYGGLKFVESAHIKDVLAFVKIVQNRNDSLSWLRILQLFDGVGPKAANKLAQLFKDPNFNWQAPISNIHKGKYNIENLLFFLSDIFTNNYKLPDLLEKIIQFYLPIFKNLYDDYEKRYKDFDVMINLSTKYSSINTFLNDMALDPPRDSVVGIDSFDKENDCLTLTTIHSAKGLEWHSVFIINMLEGYFPSSQSLSSVDSLEEERRLMYVATTRAKNNLLLTVPMEMFSRYEGYTLPKVSRFVEEINKSHICNTMYYDSKKDF
ncbi:MAG TPA: ATP-dependent helicase [Ignavibacteriales bacterium]|nr:ATP-dependent helicase [Ignavibacteriales bacterium]